MCIPGDSRGQPEDIRFSETGTLNGSKLLCGCCVCVCECVCLCLYPLFISPVCCL